MARDPGRTLMICRILPHRIASGPAQMALDEALLEAVASGSSSAVFRTYEWCEPTLSLGYFQEYAAAESDPRWHGVTIVRRATGGGAIWHHHDLTYALVLPRSHPLTARPAGVYEIVHRAIATVLQREGASARRRGVDPDRGARPFLCFLDRDPEDLVVGTSKVVGSAQRRRLGAVLQHGSVLLAQSDHTPELPGVLETGGAALAARKLGNLILPEIMTTLGLEAKPDEFTPSELAQAAELERSRYANDAWNRRR